MMANLENDKMVVTMELEKAKRSLRSEEIARKKAQANYQKLLSENEALKSYLKNLPPISEFENTKDELEVGKKTIQTLSSRLEEAKTELSNTSSQMSELKYNNTELKLQVEDLKSRLKVALSEQAAETQRYNFTSDIQKDTLLKDHDQIIQERDKLKKYIVLAKTKQDKEVKCLNSKLNIALDQVSRQSNQIWLSYYSQMAVYGRTICFGIFR